MKLKISKLSKKHLPMVDAFSCTENQEILNSYNAKKRRRVLKHSREMETFLKTESYKEQKMGLNTTHLLLNKEETAVLGYVSLCNDSIQLDFSERDSMGYSYTTIPALKIARLAVSSDYQHCGIGQLLIQFSAYIAMQMRKFSGIAFLTLDCYEHRISYYESLGFTKNLIQPKATLYDTPTSMRLGLEQYWVDLGMKS